VAFPAFSVASQFTVVSVTNSSTVNLGPGASFTGLVSSTAGQTVIVVSFKADQSVTIQVQQSVDGVNWDFVDVYVLFANVADSRTFAVIASFLRVIVTNNGASATTFLRLQTILQPFGIALPQEETLNGLKVDGAPVTPIYALSIGASATALPTRLLSLEAGPNKKTIVKAVVIWTVGTQSSSGLRNWQWIRETTPATGSTVTPNKNESSDANFSGICRPGPSASGTLGLSVGPNNFFLVPGSLNSNGPPTILDYTFGDTQKGLVIPAGISNGLLLQDSGAAGAANLNFTVFFTEA